MRIISGNARGRKLFAPAGDETRPTADRIRESLFNILNGRVYDARVLDLFGGTGALALEALSRDAAYAVIVDASAEAIRVIERNAQNVLKDEYDRRVRILRSDYRSAIGTIKGEPFDLVFLDPPYRMEDAYADAMKRLRSAGLIHRDTIILAEYARERTLTLPDGFEVYDTRFYGVTGVAFVREALG